MADEFLIWWTSQRDCERIVPLESWPRYLAEEYDSRCGRGGRGRLWISDDLERDAPASVTVSWNPTSNWLCRAADDGDPDSDDSAGGIVIRASDVRHVQFLPGFVTTFAMELPS